jgi:hypothetical protein
MADSKQIESPSTKASITIVQLVEPDAQGNDVAFQLEGITDRVHLHGLLGAACRDIENFWVNQMIEKANAANAAANANKLLAPPPGFRPARTNGKHHA